MPHTLPPVKPRKETRTVGLACLCTNSTQSCTLPSCKNRTVGLASTSTWTAHCPICQKPVALCDPLDHDIWLNARIGTLEARMAVGFVVLAVALMAAGAVIAVR